MSYEPKGIRFFDAVSNRDMLLVADGEAYAGWICCRHPDGQWVSLRKATQDDFDRFGTAKQTQQLEKPGKCPSCNNGIVYDAWFDKWFNCSDCAGRYLQRG